MAGQALTVASTLLCPHGGSVQIVAATPKASIQGAALVTKNDTFTVVGCPFQLPGPTPSPCLTVEWVATDMMVKVGGGPTLSTSSVGLCKAGTGAPQGTVIVAATQPGLSTR
jgi:hypothetical protein